MTEDEIRELADRVILSAKVDHGDYCDCGNAGSDGIFAALVDELKDKKFIEQSSDESFESLLEASEHQAAEEDFGEVQAEEILKMLEDSEEGELNQ